MKFTKLEKQFIVIIVFVIFFTSLLLFGEYLNHKVEKDNGNRMPVYSQNLSINWLNTNFLWTKQDIEHFSFNNKSQVNDYYLSDIFEIGTSKYSIGDFLVYAGTLGTVFFIFIFFVFLIVNWRKIKW